VNVKAKEECARTRIPSSSGEYSCEISARSASRDWDGHLFVISLYSILLRKLNKRIKTVYFKPDNVMDLRL